MCMTLPVFVHLHLIFCNLTEYNSSVLKTELCSWAYTGKTGHDAGIHIIINVSLALYALGKVFTALWMCFYRWGGEEPSEVYPSGHRLCTAHLFPGLFWCFGCAHADDALLPAEHPQPSASRLRLRGLGRRQVRCGCRIPVCTLYQVNRIMGNHSWITQISVFWTV